MHEWPGDTSHNSALEPKLLTSDLSDAPASAGIASAQLVLFTRYPVSGQVKTRLIPKLGAQSAARLQRRLTLCALRCAEAVQASQHIGLQLQFDGGTTAQVQHWLGDRLDIQPQTQGDLGRRLACAFDQSFRDGAQATVIIGSDCPGLTPEIIREAFARLKEHQAVLGPATDGGYYLIGLRSPVPELFRGISWGSDRVFAESLEILRRLGIQPALLPPLNDIDRPEDLPSWYRIAAEELQLRTLSVIIPALNEAEYIGPTVRSVALGKPREIIVVDGGSSDDTVQHACEAGATVLRSAAGRARQMNAGASKARGDALLFLHADTIMPENYCSAVTGQLRQRGVAAGAFRFAVAEAFPGKRFLEWSTNLRSRWLQLPYGDQGFFVRRSLFEELGGFADFPILEDYDMVRRVRKYGQVITLPQVAVTSGRRWKRVGFMRTTLLNQCVLVGYRLGWSPQKLAATYRNAQCFRR